MSTNYTPQGAISMSELFDGRMERFHIREHHNAEAAEGNRCLTDGCNFVWVFQDDAGNVESVTRFGRNAASTILSAIGQVFDTVFFSDYDGEEPAFESDEARYSWSDEQARRSLDAVFAAMSKNPAWMDGEPQFRQVIMAKADTARDLLILMPTSPLGNNNQDRLLH